MWGALLVLFFLSAVSIVSFREKLLIHLLRKTVSRVFPDATFRVDRILLGVDALEFKNVALKNTSPPAFTVSSGRLWLKFSPSHLLSNRFLAVRQAFCSIAKVGIPNLTLERVTMNLMPPADSVTRMGMIKVGILSANDIRMTDLRIPFTWTKEGLHFTGRDVAFLGGKISGGAEVFFDQQPPAVSLAVTVGGVDLGEMIRVLKLEKRFQATGAFDGELHFVVKNGRLEDFGGSLRSLQGGRFVLTDNSFKSQELLKFKGSNILVENLENYHYDIGSIAITSEGQDIGLDIKLEGKAGARNFQIFWHRVQDKEQKP
ncbi:MAG: YdbH domain-containing protein [Candidatus Omnitrophota bacterium]